MLFVTLFVDPFLQGVFVLANAFREPQTDFVLRRLHGIGAMDDISSNFDAKVAS